MVREAKTRIKVLSFNKLREEKRGVTNIKLPRKEGKRKTEIALHI